MRLINKFGWIVGRSFGVQRYSFFVPSVEEGGDGIFIPFQGMVYSIGDKVSGQDALLMEYCNLHFTNLINEALLRTNEARRRGDTMPRAPLFLGDRVEPARPPQRVRDPAQAAGGDKGKGKAHLCRRIRFHRYLSLILPMFVACGAWCRVLQ